MTYQERMAKANIERYEDSSMYDLSKAYGSWSDRKQSAWEHCKSRCEEFHGDCLKVISKNTNFFTAGFTFVDETGKRMFYYITANYEVAVDFYEED